MGSALRSGSRYPTLMSVAPIRGPRYHTFDKEVPADFALFVRSMLRLNDSKRWRVQLLEYGTEEQMTPKKRGKKWKTRKRDPRHPDGVWMYRIEYISTRPTGVIHRTVEGTWK